MAESKTLALPFVVKEIPVIRIRAYEGQPRTNFDHEALISLGASMRVFGQAELISVRPIEGDDNHDYELIDGERRWRAAKSARQLTILAMVYDLNDEKLQFRLSLLKSSGRVNLHPLELAKAIVRLESEGCSQREIAELLSIAISTVCSYRRLLQLPEPVKELMSPRRLAKYRLKTVAAMLLVDIDPEYQQDLAQQSASGELSYKELKHQVRRILGRSSISLQAWHKHLGKNKDYVEFSRFVKSFEEEVGLWSLSEKKDYRQIVADESEEDCRKLLLGLEAIKASLAKIQAGVMDATLHAYGVETENGLALASGV